MPQIVFLEVLSKPDPANPMKGCGLLVNPDVTSMPDADRQTLITAFKVLYPNTILQWHYCDHDDPIKGCITKLIA